MHPSFPACSLAELIKIGKETGRAHPLRVARHRHAQPSHGRAPGLPHRHEALAPAYKGAGPALNDLLGGHIGVLISATPNAHSHVLAGTIHALALTGARRSALLGRQADIRGGGLSGYDVPLRWGLASRRARRARLSTSSTPRSMPRWRPRKWARLALEGAEAQPMHPEDYAAIIDREDDVVRSGEGRRHQAGMRSRTQPACNRKVQTMVRKHPNAVRGRSVTSCARSADRGAGAAAAAQDYPTRPITLVGRSRRVAAPPSSRASSPTR